MTDRSDFYAARREEELKRSAERHVDAMNDIKSPGQFYEDMLQLYRTSRSMALTSDQRSLIERITKAYIK